MKEAEELDGDKKHMKKADEIAFLGIFTAIALVAGYIERQVPSPIPLIPGIKLGLANTVVLIVLYTRNNKSALVINITRILISGILFSGVSGTLYSFSGGITSFTVMSATKKSKVFGIIGVSVLGGVFHNLGQLVLAAIVVENAKLFYYMWVLVLSGVAAGILTGFIASICIQRLRVLNLVS